MLSPAADTKTAELAVPSEHARNHDRFGPRWWNRLKAWFGPPTRRRLGYAGLQIAFAFFYSVFQGYAPDTDLDNVRNRVVGILFGLIVTGLVFHYIWPERSADRKP